MAGSVRLPSWMTCAVVPPKVNEWISGSDASVAGLGALASGDGSGSAPARLGARLAAINVAPASPACLRKVLRFVNMGLVDGVRLSDNALKIIGKRIIANGKARPISQSRSLGLDELRLGFFPRSFAHLF